MINLTIKKMIRKLEFQFIPLYLVVILILFDLLNYSYHYYLLNDEIIFDLVLLILVVYLHLFLKSYNYKNEIDKQDKKLKMTHLLVFFITCFRYLLIRKKKKDQVDLIVLIDYFINNSNKILSTYAYIMMNNIKNDIEENLIKRLQLITNMKSKQLNDLMKYSYQNKLTILI